MTLYSDDLLSITHDGLVNYMGFKMSVNKIRSVFSDDLVTVCFFTQDNDEGYMFLFDDGSESEYCRRYISYHSIPYMSNITKVKRSKDGHFIFVFGSERMYCIHLKGDRGHRWCGSYKYDSNNEPIFPKYDGYENVYKDSVIVQGQLLKKQERRYTYPTDIVFAHND